MKKLSFIMIIVMLVILVTSNVDAAATPPDVNTISLSGTSGIKRITATVGGDVLSDNGSPIIERGLVYSLTNNPISGGTKIIISGTLGKYYYQLTNLNAGTRYYYAAYAVNAAGIKYGPVMNFTTKKDNIPPAIIGSIVSASNTYIDVYMSEYVYGVNKSVLTLSNFRWSFLSNGGTATAATLSGVTRTDGTPLIGGETVLRFWLSITGTPSGVETIQIWPFNGSSIYDASNRVMASTQTTGPKTLNDKALPQIFSGYLAANNTYMDITMSKGVYSYGQMPLTIAQFAMIFIQNDGTATNATISGVTNKSGGPLVGGETVIRVLITVQGTASGDEFVTIGPKDGVSIYDSSGNPMSASQTTGPKHLNDLMDPAIINAVLSANNSFIDIDFNEGIYNANLLPLSKTDLKVIFMQNDGNAASAAISSITNTDGTALTGGETSIRVYLNFTGIPSGVETIEIQPVSGASVFDDTGNALSETQTTGIFTLLDIYAPIIKGALLSPDNSYIDITANEGLYGVNGGVLTAENLALTFLKNEGNSTAATILKVSQTNGNNLVGGESVIRVFLAITGTPNGVETISIAPINDASVYDMAGNSMLSTQTTGPKTLNARIPIKKLIHTLKVPKGRIVGIAEKTFIPGDYVPMSIRLDVLSTVLNPTIVADLDSSSSSFCLKAIQTGAGSVDESTVNVYKNGVKLSGSLVGITVKSADSTFNIVVNQSFSSGDVLEVVYYTRLSLTDTALRSKVRPTYGVGISFSSHVEWGAPVNYYSSSNPGAEGLDQFNADIIVANPNLLQ